MVVCCLVIIFCFPDIEGENSFILIPQAISYLVQQFPMLILACSQILIVLAEWWEDSVPD